MQVILVQNTTILDGVIQTLKYIFFSIAVLWRVVSSEEKLYDSHLGNFLTQSRL